MVCGIPVIKTGADPFNTALTSGKVPSFLLKRGEFRRMDWAEKQLKEGLARFWGLTRNKGVVFFSIDNHRESNRYRYLSHQGAFLVAASSLRGANITTKAGFTPIL